MQDCDVNGVEGCVVWIDDDHISVNTHEGGGDDWCEGNDGDDAIDGGAGADDFRGNAGMDFLFDGDGTDDMFGGSGNDVMSGNANDDFMLGGDDNDTMKGGAGDDALDGGAGTDILWGDEGNNQGTGGNDFLHDVEGNGDTLNGEDGKDLLFAQDSTGDYLDGGTGTDYSVIDTTMDTSIDEVQETNVENSAYLTNTNPLDGGVPPAESSNYGGGNPQVRFTAYAYNSNDFWSSATVTGFSGGVRN